MKVHRSTLILVAALAIVAPGRSILAESVPVPPKADVMPKSMTEHGQTRVDNYFWLRERENPKVIAYLEAENTYTDAMMKHTADFQDRLFEEIKGRIKQDDQSVPYRYDDYFYYDRQEAGKEYSIYCRKHGSLDAPEKILVDVNVLAEGHGYFSVSGIDPSPDHAILAYGVDTVGRRGYSIYFKDMTTGELLPDVIPDVTGNLVWAADNKTVFYSDRDTTTLRWDRIYRHTLGTDAKNDPLLYTETDETYYTWVEKSKSRQYIFIHCQQTLADEYQYLDASTPLDAFQMFLPRTSGHEYSVDHGDRFYIRTNLEAKNFRLMSCGLAETGQTAKWKEEIPHRPVVYLEGIDLFRQHLVVIERQDGLLKFRVRQASGEDYYIDFGEPAYDVVQTDNYTYDTPIFRYTYTSLTTPRSVFDYDLGSRASTLLKVTEVLGGFDKNNYATERLYAPARDGARVPISLVYRKDKFKKDGSNPLLLYGYGAYGLSTDATFSSVRLSLIDRGFVYAIAHIRGGQELGREWYENGRQLQKKNTFYDFIDCGKYLKSEGYAELERAVRLRRIGRRTPDRRGAQHAARPVGRTGGRRAVRGRDQYHARRHDSAHGERMGRVGQSSRFAVLRLHAIVFALRQRCGEGLPTASGSHRPARFAGAVLGAGQVGGPAARHQDRPPPPAPENRNGSRARRRLGPLQAIPGVCVHVCVHPGLDGHQQVKSSSACAGTIGEAPRSCSK